MVLVRLNPWGYKISSNDVQDILSQPDNNIIRDMVAQFFGVESSNLSNDLLTRYAEACDQMTNISVGAANEEINDKLIGSIASAKRCYCYAEYLACIELCALSGEMFANFQCIIHEEQLKTDDVINKLNSKNRSEVRRVVTQLNSYDELNQKIRIDWIEAGNYITSANKDDLLNVHDLRTKYYHHWEQGHAQLERDAINALVVASRVISSATELYENENNIRLLRAYINSRANQAST